MFAVLFGRTLVRLVAYRHTRSRSFGILWRIPSDDISIRLKKIAQL
nr:MAG TPA: hypothetical protein [Microviridae sp.]